MKLALVSNSHENRGRTLRGYNVDGITTVGVQPGEPYGIRFYNTTGSKIQVKVAVDGTDVLTGKKANLETAGRMFVLQPLGSLSLDAWPESTRGGAGFVFANSELSVAANTHGDQTAEGYISVAVFVEDEPFPQPQVVDYPANYLLCGQHPYTRGVRGASPSYGAAKGGVTMGVESMRGPATGAGSYVEQYIGTTRGLTRPKYSELVQVRYVWWSDLERQLADLRIEPTLGHPTGFEPPAAPLADLGNTPRIEDATTVRPTRYSRFA